MTMFFDGQQDTSGHSLGDLKDYITTHLSASIAREVAIGRIDHAIRECGHETKLNDDVGMGKRKHALDQATLAVKRATGGLPRRQDMALSKAMLSVRSGMKEVTGQIQGIHKYNYSAASNHISATKAAGKQIAALEDNTSRALHTLIDRVEKVEADPSSEGGHRCMDEMEERLQQLELDKQERAKTDSKTNQTMKLTSDLIRTQMAKIAELQATVNTMQTDEKAGEPATKPEGGVSHGEQSKHLEAAMAGVSDALSYITEDGPNAAADNVSTEDESEREFERHVQRSRDALNEIRNLRACHNEQKGLRANLSKIERTVKSETSFVNMRNKKSASKDVARAEACAVACETAMSKAHIEIARASASSSKESAPAESERVQTFLQHTIADMETLRPETDATDQSPEAEWNDAFSDAEMGLDETF
jgi:hypothetical protein